MSLLPIFVCICIYEIGNDMTVLLPLTGDTMQRRTGSYTVPAATVGVFTAVFRILTAFVYDRGIVPFFYKRGVEVSKLWTIGVGIAFELLALLAAALVEKARQSAIVSSGLQEKYQAAKAVNPDLRWDDPALFTVPMSIWWQAIPYSLMGICDTLVTTGFADLAYSQVSAANKALAIALSVVANAGGGFLAAALNSIISQATKGDLWLANNTLYGHYDWYYFVNMGITAVALLLFPAAAARFQLRLITVEEQGDQQRQLQQPQQQGGKCSSSSSGGGQGHTRQLVSADDAEGSVIEHWTMSSEHEDATSSSRQLRNDMTAAGAVLAGSDTRQQQRTSSCPGLQAPLALSGSFSVSPRQASFVSAAASPAAHHLRLRRNTISAANVPASHGSFVTRLNVGLQAELQACHRCSTSEAV